MAETKKQNKKYYWMRLPKDFFNSKEMKKLRTIAGGEIYTIIYLKMQLLSIDNNAYIEFEGTEETIAEQLSYELDESKENIAMTLSFLLKHNLVEMCQDDLDMLQTKELIGVETASTIRSRKHRNEQKVLQCNTNATDTQQECNTEIEKEIELEIKKDISTLNTYGQKSLTVEPKDEFNQSESFNLFWVKYGKKVKKQESLNKFKLHVKDADTFRVLMNDLYKREFTDDWIKQEGRFRPYPSTYLNGKMWNDEYETDLDGFEDNKLVKCDVEVLLNKLSKTIEKNNCDSEEVRELIDLLDTGFKTTKEFVEELKARIMLGGSE